MASTLHGIAPVNGTTTPSPAEDEELYSELLRLRDVVLAGKHASLKLPSSAIERLKASLIVPDAQAQNSQQPLLNNATNSSAFATNQTQHQQSTSFPKANGLPGLQASSIPYPDEAAQTLGVKRLAAAGLDPIFLEKSDSLVRAEGQLKRQRLDRDIQNQVEQRKHSSRDKDPGVEAPSPIDIDHVLLVALERVKPVSGLKERERSRGSSSFDENDYYSSQVQSDWSSEAHSSKASDRAAGAFTADFERLDGSLSMPSSFAQHSSRLKEPSARGALPYQTSKDRPHVYNTAPEDAYEVGDDDDDYTPPDATAFDGFREGGTGMEMGHPTPPDDENSDYEPGEITDSNILTPQHQGQQPAQPSPRVPVIRNHLTHIVAPQPNRVSPLATAKNSNYELELVNGRPEMVQKPQYHQQNAPTRVSTASPSGAGASGRKKKSKKRKRDAEPPGRAKRRHRQAPSQSQQAPPAYDTPYIKNEPVSPPPFASLPDVPPYDQAQNTQQRPIEIDMNSPRYTVQPHYFNEPARSGLRYEDHQPTSPTYVRVASPSMQRPMARDTQDLRRMASLHLAQRPPSPRQRPFSPIGPYVASFSNYNGTQPEARAPPRYEAQAIPESSHYIRDERSRSPPQPQGYRESYVTGVQSPAMMPPPPAPVGPQRRIIVDQNGNRYWAAESLPPPPAPRVSAVPSERRSQADITYERLPSYAPASSYPPVPSPRTTQYEFTDSRMVPPPPPSRRQQHPAPEQRVAQAETNGYYTQDYTNPQRYTEAPTSPTYQQVRGYEQVPPAHHLQHHPTSPVYIPTRSYSIQPEEPSQQQVLRHASVAPVQYVRRDAPAAAVAPVRAVSVMPASTSEYGGMPLQLQQQQQQMSYSRTASQAIRYVDQHGNEVFPREVRQVGEYRY